MMNNRFFDFEVFPDWWCCVFGDTGPEIYGVVPDIKDTFAVITSDDPHARDKLIKKLTQPDFCNLGYNIKYYDLIIANAIYQGLQPAEIKLINDLIIDPEKVDSPDKYRLLPLSKRKFNKIVYQDLMDDSNGSLKDKEMVLGLDILESSVPFNKEDLTDEEKADVIYYCKQDVYAAIKFYEKIVQPYTKAKMALARKAGIDERTARACTNAKLVSLALNAMEVKFDDAEKVEIKLPESIRQYCYDNLRSDVLNKLLTSKEGFEAKLFGNDVSFGNGGIHSVLSTNLYVESDSEYTLVNVDAASYYPSILIQFDCLSRTVFDKKIFVDTFNERITIKHKEIKTEDDTELEKADKLILNTTFGASGNKWLALYDPYMCTRTCRVGQIFLASLASKIDRTIPSAKIIQTNTDGILVYIKRSEMPMLKELQNEWSRISDINMDTDHVLKIWQRDVNNYLLIKEEHGVEKIKRKGGWLNDTYLKPGYTSVASVAAYASAKAAKDWLVNGKSIRSSIMENDNLFDFIMCCVKGSSFKRCVQRMSDGAEIPLYKSNRIIATTDTSYGKIYKIKMYKGEESYYQMPNIPEHCYTVNKDLSTYSFDEIKKILDYNYYIDRALDLLNIEWLQWTGDRLVRTHVFDARS